MCRRAAGAPYMAFVTFRRENLAFDAARPTLYRSSTIAVRGFCGRCGTAMTYEGDHAPEGIDVAIATLDDPAAIPPIDQIFTADAIGWAQDLSALPSYPGSRSP